jgi:hypothetical protein
MYSSDDQILSQLPTRKEMRKQGLGLVRFTPDTIVDVDERKLGLEVPWEAGPRSEGSDGGSDAEVDDDTDDENESADDDDDDGSSEDEHEEDEDQSAREDENEDTAEELPPSIPEPRKRKRGKVDPPRLPPAKRVAFQRTGVDNNPPKKPSAVLQTPRKRKQPAPIKKKTVANIPTKSKALLDKHATQDAYDFAQFFGGGRIP